MDPVVLMHGNGDLVVRDLMEYLGPARTPEQKTEANLQGLKLLQLYGVVPSRNTPATCPECHEELRTVADTARYGWRFCCRNHNGRVLRYSPLSNTFLQKVRLGGEMGADRIVLIMYWWFLRYPLKEVRHQLSLSRESAVYWYGFCRDVACAIAWHDYTPIGGDGDVVEVDETHLFKRKNNVGRLTEWRHTWVVGGISRTTKKRFAIIVPTRDADTLLPLLHQCIDDRSYLCTDYWLAYGACNRIFNGHGRINHSENFIFPPRGEPPLWMPAGRFNQECLDLQYDQPPPVPGMQPFRISTQNIERSWLDLKTLIRTTNSQDYASQYIGEWMYRKNILERVQGEKRQFERFLRDVARVYPGVGKVAMRVRYEDILNCDCHECEP